MQSVIEHRRPDNTVVDKQTALLIDIAVPRSAEVDAKEQEKIGKCLAHRAHWIFFGDALYKSAL